jgi:hypothetical protein
VKIESINKSCKPICIAFQNELIQQKWIQETSAVINAFHAQKLNQIRQTSRRRSSTSSSASNFAYCRALPTAAEPLTPRRADENSSVTSSLVSQYSEFIGRHRTWSVSSRGSEASFLTGRHWVPDSEVLKLSSITCSKDTD